jgi:hypothetical protein
MAYSRLGNLTPPVKTTRAYYLTVLTNGKPQRIPFDNLLEARILGRGCLRANNFVSLENQNSTKLAL